MKKIYYVQKIVDAVFLCDAKENRIISEADRFIVEEAKNRVPNRFLIKEVKSKEDIPEGWHNSLIWGTEDDEDLTVMEALHKLVLSKDSEYKEYLRLKAKFE
jgi:hypothetical protein